MKARWRKFEDQVRGIAGDIYGKPCEPKNLVGSDVDGYIEIDRHNVVLIEATINHTVDKVRTDIVKLTNVRNALFLKGVFAKCLVVTAEHPTNGMIKGGEDNNIDVLSVNQLASQFLEYDRYRLSRLQYPFGSAVNPESGEMDKTAYVPVAYEDRRTGKQFTFTEIAERLVSGENVVILGEYGSGKSRCVSEVFDAAAKEWGATFQFPVAINLRECWGLEKADEIIRRHFDRLGLDDMKAPAVRAYNRKNLLFLLDGFDEIGIQSWSNDDSRLRQLRAQALVGAKDAIQKSGTGTLITGREHYFSSEKEMFSSLGLSTSTLVLHVKEEFSLDELAQYFKSASIDVTLPDWLPRRPLICQTISQLSDEERDNMFGVGDNEAGFWNYFIKVICKRDARINASFDEDTIYEVFVYLATLTRTKSENVGPIDQRELQAAFESVVGQLPVENAAVMLQRLPSLGRVGPDSGDRRFIDTYILDGLRAHGVARILQSDEEHKRNALAISWANPLQPLGQKVLASLAVDVQGSFLSLARRAAREKNRTLASDIVTGLMRLGAEAPDFAGLEVKDAAIAELDFTTSDVQNVSFDSCTIEQLILPTAPPRGTLVRNCLITRVSGASSIAGLASWIAQNDIEEFDSVTTVRRIRDAGLGPAHEVLVAIIKKTFFQPGTGRKEEALLRGFAAGKYNKVASKVLNILVNQNILSTFKGDEGTVYKPNRAQTGRMKQMLDGLRSSDDIVWRAVSDI